MSDKVRNNSGLPSFNGSLYLLGLISFSVLIFSGVLSNSNFIFDDGLHISEASKMGLLDLIIPFKTTAIPVFYAVIKSFSAVFSDYLPLSLKVLNLVIHCLNGFILFRLLAYKKCSKWDSYFYFICSFIFILHPINLESVVWWSSLKGVLSLFFALLAILFYFRGSYMSLFFIVLSSLVKPITIVFLPAIIYYRLYVREKSIKVTPLTFMAVMIMLVSTQTQFLIQAGSYKSILSFIISPLFVLSILVCSALYFYKTEVIRFIRVHQERLRISLFLIWLLVILSALLNTWLYERFVYVSNSLFFYFKKIFYDFNYYFDYGVNRISINELSLKILPFIFSVSVLAFIYLQRKLKMILLALALFTLILPSVGIFETRSSSISIVSDRYVYNLLFFLVVFGGYYLGRFKKMRWFVTVPVLVTLITFNFINQSNWKDSQAMLTKSIANNPNSFPVLMALSTVVEDDLKQYEIYRKAFVIRPLLKESQSKYMRLSIKTGNCLDMYAIVMNTSEGNLWTSFGQDTANDFIKCLKKINASNLHLFIDFYQSKYDISF